MSYPLIQQTYITTNLNNFARGPIMWDFKWEVSGLQQVLALNVELEKEARATVDYRLGRPSPFYGFFWVCEDRLFLVFIPNRIRTKDNRNRFQVIVRLERFWRFLRFKIIHIIVYRYECVNCSSSEELATWFFELRLGKRLCSPMLTYDDNMFPKIVLLSQKNTCLCFLRRPVSVESEVNENSAIKLDYM